MGTFLPLTLSVAAAEVDDRTQFLPLFLAARSAQKGAIMAGTFIAALLSHLVLAMFGVWLAQELSPDVAKWTVGISFIMIGLWLLLPNKDKDLGSRWLKYGAFNATVVLFSMAEIGDRTQTTTILLTAKYQELFMVVAGNVVGMMTTSVPVVYLDEILTKKIPAKKVRLMVCMAFRALGILILLSGGLVFR